MRKLEPNCRSLHCYLLALCLLAPGWVFAIPEEQEHYEFYEQGVAAYESAEYGEAVVHLKNALKHDPRDLPSRILLGWSQLRLGNAAGAAKDLQMARRLGADEELVLVPLGNAYLLQRQHRQVLEEIRSSNPAKLGGSDVLVIRGQAHLQLGELSEAEEMFRAALEESPGYVEGHLGMVRVAFARADLETARTFSQEALELAPDSAESWFLDGELLRVQSAFPDALEAYNRALELNSGHMRARNSRASVLLELNRPEDALLDLDFILELVPQDAQAAYLKAMAEARAGDRTAARLAIERASENLMQLSSERMQREPASVLLAGVVAHSAGSLDQSRQHLKRYIQMRPKHVGSRKLLGRVLLDMGLGVEAVEVLYPALNLAPDDPELLALTGSAMLMQHDFREAASLFERAIELLPEDADTREQLAVGQLGTGQNELALDSLRKVVAENPSQHRAAVLLTMLYSRTGRSEEAMFTANQLLERWPKETTYLNLRGSLFMSRGDLAAARADFETAIDIASHYVPAQLNLAKISMIEGDLDDAAERYQRVLDVNPRETIALRSMARVAVARGDIKKAIAYTEEVRAIGSGNVGVSVDLVALYLQAGEYQTARDLGLRLVSDYPESPEAIEVLALVEIAMGNTSNAREVLRRVARFSNLQISRLLRIARLQVSIEDYQGAEVTLERAVQQEQESTLAITSLVRLDLLLGRRERALQRAQEVRQSRPGDTLGWTLTGDVLVEGGSHLRAIAYYQMAQSRLPDPFITVKLGNAWRAAGYPHAATWVLEQWMGEYPEDILVYRSLASAYLMDGDLDRALFAHELLQQQFPDDVGILNNLAWIYNDRGDERALGLAEQAYALSPDDPLVLDTLGWVLVKSGNSRSALAYLRQAQSRSSKNPQIHYHLAFALSELERETEARNLLQVLLAANPSFPEREEAQNLLERLVD